MTPAAPSRGRYFRDRLSCGASKVGPVRSETQDAFFIKAAVFAHPNDATGTKRGLRDRGIHPRVGYIPEAHLEAPPWQARIAVCLGWMPRNPNGRREGAPLGLPIENQTNLGSGPTVRANLRVFQFDLEPYIYREGTVLTSTSRK